jgi:hypothetical protein
MIRTRSLAALVSLALLAMMGCISLPTEPLRESTGGGSPDPGTAPDSSAVLPPPLRAATSTKLISGSVGGTVSAGNFTVVIPPLAVSGTVAITVTQPDPSKPVVDLGIVPATANDFKVAVTLIANAAPMDANVLSAAYVAWWDPSAGAWVPMPSTVDPVSRLVSCPLSHFSQYSVQVGGKAGW